VVTQASAQQLLPEYDNPPLNEVVCGILFKRIDAFLNPYLGLLWERYRPEYAECLEVVPLVPVIERFDKPSPPEPQADLEAPLLPRTWFVHANGNGVIQVQRDRFLHNWRKIRPDDAYPRYRHVISMFQSHLSQFTQFLAEHNLGVVTPLQYELTYINHIMQGEGWDTIHDVGKIFPHFAWEESEDSFLSSPESVLWQTSFVLPNQAGRLRTKLQSATRRGDGHPLFVFELTVRGIGTHTTLDTMWHWFELAHEWVVRGFADLTNPQVQKDIWRRSI
jgi:uncharacterized protein (TIGR04255 family)